MMNPKELKDAWQTVVKIYNETRDTDPQTTMQKIIGVLGKDKAKEVFACVTQLKSHDGRIYGENRKAMNQVQVDPDALVWESRNPMTRAGLDDIHTTHINQLITEGRKVW